MPNASYPGWAIDDDGFAFWIRYDRDEAVKIANTFIKVLKKYAGDNRVDETWDPDFPYDGKLHALGDGVKYICEAAPFPDQEQSCNEGTPRSIRDSFIIRFIVEGARWDSERVYSAIRTLFDEFKYQQPP
jgi:hypothetical protein